MVTVVHCKKSPYTVYGGRPGPLGNHHNLGLCKHCGKDHKRGEAIEAFKVDFYADDPRGEQLRKSSERLDSNAVLGCWCKPLNCHCDVIAEYRNGLPAGSKEC